MSLYVKYCWKCKRAYDFQTCPYCRERELKKKRGKDGRR